jgi:hypothetical protein
LHEGYTHVANHTCGMSAWDGERTFPSSISWKAWICNL